MSEHFDIYYLLRSLQMACEMASRNVVTQAQYDFSFFESAFAFFQQKNESVDIPSIQIYYQTFLLITQKNPAENYRLLRSLLQAHSALLSSSDLNDIYAYILNYCIQQINLGKTEFYAEIFDWYKILLQEEIIFENNQLSDKTFMNIVTASLRMKAYAWSENFIHQYKSTLKTSIRQNAVAYNLAALYYAKKEYNRALLQLIDVEFTDSFYHIGSNIIQLKSYFQLDETEAYFALIQSIRQYVQRSKQLSTYHKMANLNFLKLAKQIYQVKLSVELVPKNVWRKKQERLLEKVQQSNPLSNKEWLEDILDF